MKPATPSRRAGATRWSCLLALGAVFGLLSTGLAQYEPAGQASRFPPKTRNVQTQRLDILTPLIPPGSGLNCTVINGPGATTYWYWLVVTYPGGNSAPVGFGMTNGPAALTPLNYVRCTWQTVPGATSYALLRTGNSTPPTGTGAIAAATTLNQNWWNDQGGALGVYTVSTTANEAIACSITSTSNTCGSCPDGASLTQYIDSTAGDDGRTGLNWCSSKATLAAGVTALGAGGGWLYTAPEYSGSEPTGLATNLNVLETGQIGTAQTTGAAVGTASVRRYAFPDWSTNTPDQNIFAFWQGSSDTVANSSAVWTAVNPFGSSALFASIGGSIRSPATVGSTGEVAGVVGFATTTGAGTENQHTGAGGYCYDPGTTNAINCTGVVGAVANASGAHTAMEGMWANLKLADSVSHAEGFVARTQGGFMPTATVDINGYANAAYSVRHLPVLGSENVLWPTGFYVEDGTTTQPAYFGLNQYWTGAARAALTDRGNNGLKFAWQDNAVATKTTQFYVTGGWPAGVATPNTGGDVELINSKFSTTVTTPTNVSGKVPVSQPAVDLTGQHAPIGATTLYAVPASSGGQYWISFNAKVTTAGAVSSTLGGTNGFQVIYTDADDSVVVTTAKVANNCASLLTGNTTQTLYCGSVIVNAKGGTNLQFQLDYTDGGGGQAMNYNLHVRVAAM